MSYEPNTPPRPTWEEKLREAASRIEDEVRRVATILDEEVVPEVRRTGAVALRAASERLAQLAQHMDDKARGDAGDPQK